MTQAILYADRVAETTTTTGTGTVTLAGAKTGYLTFASAFAVGTLVYYCITDNASTIEVGVGTLATSTTLARTTVRYSTNGNALVSLSTGTYDVFCTLPAYIVQRVGSKGKTVAMVNGMAMS